MNILEEFVDITDILAPISAVLSTTFFPLSKEKTLLQVKDFGNLIAAYHVIQIKKLIHNFVLQISLFLNVD